MMEGWTSAGRSCKVGLVGGNDIASSGWQYGGRDVILVESKSEIANSWHETVSTNSRTLADQSSPRSFATRTYLIVVRLKTGNRKTYRLLVRHPMLLVCMQCFFWRTIALCMVGVWGRGSSKVARRWLGPLSRFLGKSLPNS